jgi:hypothetical protein
LVFSWTCLSVTDAADSARRRIVPAMQVACSTGCLRTFVKAGRLGASGVVRPGMTLVVGPRESAGTDLRYRNLTAAVAQLRSVGLSRNRMLRTESSRWSIA